MVPVQGVRVRQKCRESSHMCDTSAWFQHSLASRQLNRNSCESHLPRMFLTKKYGVYLRENWETKTTFQRNTCVLQESSLFFCLFGSFQVLSGVHVSKGVRRKIFILLMSLFISAVHYILGLSSKHCALVRSKQWQRWSWSSGMVDLLCVGLVVYECVLVCMWIICPFFRFSPVPWWLQSELVSSFPLHVLCYTGMCHLILLVDSVWHWSFCLSI